MARKKKKRAGSPARRAGKIFYRTAVVLSAVVVVLFCTYKLASKKPGTAPDPAVTPPSVADMPTGQPEDRPEDSGLKRRDDTFTFLLAAEDQESGNADTMMVVTYDTVSQTVGIVSIPRDTLVKAGKLNSVYHKGVDTLKDTVSDLLGIPIDHYITVNMRGFVKLVDELGGIKFDVPVRMAYDDPTQNLHIHYEKGLQSLSGTDVLKVARCRKNSDKPGTYPNNVYDTYPDADIGRTRTQQQLLAAIVKKALSNPQKAGSYVSIFTEYVDTDLTASELLWFLEPALGFDFATGITSATLPGDGNTSYGRWGNYCYQLYPDEVLPIVNEIINPYTEDITLERMNIFQVK